MRTWLAGRAGAPSVWILVLCGLLATACAANDATELEAGSSPTVVVGVGYEAEVFPFPERPEPHSRPVPGELQLVECRWVAPGSYEFDLRWQPDSPGSAQLAVYLDVSHGDQGLGLHASLTVETAATITVPIDLLWQYQRVDEGEEWSLNRGIWERETSGSCEASIGLDESASHAGTTRISIEPPPAVVQPGQGSLDQAVAALNLGGDTGLLLPLAWLAAIDAPLSIDRLAIVEGHRLDLIRVSQIGTCVSIFSSYDSGTGLTTQLQQERGCARLDTGSITEGGSWSLGITPGFVEPVWLTSEGVDPPPAATEFDATAWLAAYRNDNPDLVVLASFDWEGGLVAVVDGHPDGSFMAERYADPLVVTPEPFGGGGSGSGCEAYGYTVKDDGTRAFVIVVAERSGLEFDFGPDLDFSWISIDSEGRSVGFADLTGKSARPTPIVTGASGQPVPCVQS